VLYYAESNYLSSILKQELLDLILHQIANYERYNNFVCICHIDNCIELYFLRCRIRISHNYTSYTWYSSQRAVIRVVREARIFDVPLYIIWIVKRRRNMITSEYQLELLKSILSIHVERKSFDNRIYLYWLSA